MDKEELKKQYKLRDRTVRALSKNGKFRIAAIKNTNCAKVAQKRHGLDIVPAFLLARQLSAASLIASFLKGEERIIVEAEGDGPVKKVFAEAVQAGEVRGFVKMSEEKEEYKINSLSDALGKGTYMVSHILYNKSEPVSGIVDLQNGDIATDLAYYYSQSEQISSAVILDTDFDDKGIIRQSGGLILQAMPGATDENLEEVYNSLQNISKVTDYYDKGLSPLGLLGELMPFEFDVVRSSPVDFFCRCSKENFMEKMITLGVSEIKDLQKNNNNKLVCQYCNETYILEKKDFKKLIEDASAKSN